MRSMFSYAALLAAVTMTGCCGTGNCCLSHGLFGGRAASQAAPVQYDTMQYETSGDCGCGCDGAVSDASWDGVASGDDYGVVTYVDDCGCQPSSSGQSGVTACEACGDDAVVSVSAPFDCGDAGCGCGTSGTTGSVRRVVSGRKARVARRSARGTSMNFSDAGVSCDSCETGDCGSSDCGCDAGDSMVSTTPCDSGCDSCGGGDSYDSYDSCGGCDSCDGGDVVSTPSENIRGNKGLGLFMKSRGKMCGSKKGGCWLFGKRKSKTAAAASACSDAEIYDDTDYVDEGWTECDSCDSGCETCDTLSASDDAGGRRISNGIISDIKEMHPRVAAHHGLGGRRGLHGADSGCGVNGCGTHGLCRRCAGGFGSIGAAHPYGGATPHTRPQPGQSGMAPTQMYPYYTTRGPRDFLRDNPPSIGY